MRKLHFLSSCQYTHGCYAPASWAAQHTTVCLDNCSIHAIVDLVAQWSKRETGVVQVFIMDRVQILKWIQFFFIFAHLFIITFSLLFFFFLYIGFGDHLLSFLPHLLHIYCSFILKTFFFLGIDIRIGNFLANILVIGILENFHIGAPLTVLVHFFLIVWPDTNRINLFLPNF